MTKLAISIYLSILLVLSMASVVASNKKSKKAVRMRAEYYYVDLERFVCSVENSRTKKLYYGVSKKEKYAELYARTGCQMRSYSGQCYRQAHCEHKLTSVRKRRYVPA